MNEEVYWKSNVPLQVMPVRKDPDDESSPVIGYQVLNYQPRREMLGWIPIEEVLYGLTHEQFFARASIVLSNLSRLMGEIALGKRDTVYYPDEGLNQ